METASCRDEPQEHEWEDQRANDLTRVEQLREQRIFTANKQFKSHLSLAEWYVDFGKPAKAIAELEKALQISEATGKGDAKKLLDACQRASLPKAAKEALRSLTDDELAAFKAREEVPAKMLLHPAALNPMLVDSWKQHVVEIETERTVAAEKAERERRFAEGREERERIWQEERDRTRIDPAATTYRLARPLKDFSYAGAKRIGARIVIPLGRTRSQVRATLTRAAKEIAQQTNADAVSVLAYRPNDSPDSVYTVGMADYAPYGDWSRADEDGPMQLSIKIGELYFQQGSHLDPRVGDTVTFASKYATVSVSNSWEEWGDDSIIAEVPNGTRAVILERRSEAMSSDSELVRYRVRVGYGATTIEGWVHSWDIRK